MCVVGCKKTEFRVRIAWDCKQARPRVVGGEVEDCNEEENVGLRSRIWLCDRGKAIRRNSGKPKKWGWDCGEGRGCKAEKKDCRGRKRIGRRKVQHSPPKAKIVHNRCNPGRIQEKCAQSCSEFEGGIREPFRGERGPSPAHAMHMLCM